jgi:nicotinamidase-related amidase
MLDHEIPRIKLDRETTALVFTDLHNDFLAQDGKAFGLSKESLARNNTAENIERAAKTVGMKVFVSPHYYYPHDHGCVARVTPLEDLAHKIGLVNRKDPLSLDGFEGSGADFPTRYKPYLHDAQKIQGAASRGLRRVGTPLEVKS